jgi:hypothetical protein
MQVLGFRLTVEVPLLASGFEVASFSHLLKYLAQFHLAFGVPMHTSHSLASAHKKMVLARWMQELANKLKLKPETSVGTSLASKRHFQKHWGQHHSDFFKQRKSTEQYHIMIFVSAMEPQMFVQEKHPHILEIWLSGFHQRNVLGDIAICCSTYRNHVHNAWSNSCLIAHELLDIRWKTNVTSRNYSVFYSSLEVKITTNKYPYIQTCQLMICIQQKVTNT